MKLNRILPAAFIAAWLPACLLSARPPASQPEQTAVYSASPGPTQSSASDWTLQTLTAEFSEASGTVPAQPVLTSTPAVAGPVYLPPVTPGNLFSIREQLRLNSRARLLDVTYCLVDKVALKLDFFLPELPLRAAPLVILVHGGGWSEGGKGGGEGLADGPALLAAGFAFASLDYRLAPQHQFPAMIQDVKCAIRFFRAHAGDFRIDPQHIGIYGPSAGGHLASLAGLSGEVSEFEAGEWLQESSRVQAVVDIYGPADLTVDFSPSITGLKQQVFGDFDLEQASPLAHVSTNDPPFLILHGELDRVVPLSQSQALYEALTGAGVPVELVVVQDGGHGFEGGGISPTRVELTAMIVRFFIRYLKP